MSGEPNAAFPVFQELLLKSLFSHPVAGCFNVYDPSHGVSPAIGNMDFSGICSFPRKRYTLPSTRTAPISE